MKKSAWVFIGSTILFLSISIGIWGMWIYRQIMQGFELSELIIEPEQGSYVKFELGNSRLIFKWQPIVQVGNISYIHIELIPNDQQEGLLNERSIHQQEFNKNSAQKGSSALANMLIEANIEVSQMLVAPANEMLMFLRPGQPVRFIWSVIPTDLGIFQGKVWLHLRLISSSGETLNRIPITAQRFTVKSVKFLGLSGPNAKLLGTIGMILGLVIVMISILADNTKR